MTSLVGITVALAMLFASVGAPGIYTEVTISDPVLEITSEGTTMPLDLTGLTLTLGGGANAAGDAGVYRATMDVNGMTMGGVASIQNGLATVAVDGLEMLLTSAVPGDAELESMLQLLAGIDLDVAALRNPAETEPYDFEQLIPDIVAYLDGLEMETRQTSTGDVSLFNGEETYTVFRTDFTMNSEQIQALIMTYYAEIAALSSQLDVSALEDVSEDAKVEGSYCYADDVVALYVNIYEGEGAEPVYLGFSLRLSGDDFRVSLIVTPDEENRLTVDASGVRSETTPSLAAKINLVESGEESMSMTLDLTCPQEGACKVKLAGAQYGQEMFVVNLDAARVQEGESLTADMTMDASMYGYPVFAFGVHYAGTLTEADGTTTCAGTLEVQASAEGTDIFLKCGLNAKVAPLDGYLVTELPDLPAADVNALTPEQTEMLQNVGMRFTASLMTLPGVIEFINSMNTVNTFPDESPEGLMDSLEEEAPTEEPAVPAD